MGDDTGEGDRDSDGSLALILERLGDGEEGTARLDFARAVLRRVPSAQLAHSDPAAVAAALTDSFGFVDTRPPGTIRIRVFDPEAALDGAPRRGSVVEVSCEDREFIVSSVTEELRRLGHRVVRELHPVFGSVRDADGRLTAVLPARPAADRESFLHVEVASRIPPAARTALVRDLEAVLADVFAATGDYAEMRRRVLEAATRVRSGAGSRFPRDEAQEVAALLEWLLEGNLVLSGCCWFRWPGGEAVDALGVLSRPDARLRTWGPDHEQEELLRIRRTREVSTVHRQVLMHRVDLLEVDARGRPAGVFRVVGVFTGKANAESAALTPVLRFKLRRILELEDVVERSQDEAALVSLFQVLPKDQLFESDVPTLRRVLLELLAAEEEHDVRVLLRVDEENHTVTALLSVPGETYNAALRQRLERFLLAQLDGERVDADVALGHRPEAVVRMVVYVAGPLPEPPLDSLARELRLLCRTWEQQLTEALAAAVGEPAGSRLGRTWADWFPPAYRDVTAPHLAVADVLELDALFAGDAPIRIVLAAAGGAPPCRLKVFTKGAGVELSAFLPILESLGLWAVEDRPYALGGDEPRAHLHDFGVSDPAGSLDVDRHGPRLAAAALALWQGRADVDALNRLVLRSGLGWDDVAVLRAYRRYRSQVGTTFTTAYVDQVLVEHAAIAGALVEYFAALFDPVGDARAEVVAELRQRVVDACDAVARLDHDRILRGFLALVDATLRTNRYLDRSGEATTVDHLVLKLDSAAVPGMPAPVPYREIFVHGPLVEGVHLRWGPVARGGIRWSDRVDDYRSEVLGLMRAQVLKNALIVPTGAKGGFVVKRQPVDVPRAYAIFVAGMLEVTDDVVGDDVVPVPRRRDGDDPYLVVAADRGTAKLSDLANRISTGRGFWLGDAFASGGASGYDHKRLGITARGAWVAVRHHFAELEIDVQSEPVTVAGIGDMSGDVFGNAMLRSDLIRLVAAFDHRDIFLDPDPDPAASFRERARLFALPASSWQDYDRSLISPGGGVWSRLDKRVPLSEQVRALLRADSAELTAPELIRAILRAPVGLLFPGGIGTFVRASTEPDQDVDDRANADVRVEGSSVRARVVGEGANLAFTQRARIEYARRGGHINTDAVDNAGGVDISDREVNLKILLRPAVETGELTLAGRDRILAEVCDDVVAAVLHDCALQSMALTRARAASPSRMPAAERLVEELEAAGVVDRAVEALPTAAEMQARQEAGAGLTRPELAVLLAGAKRNLVARLLASEVPDQSALRLALAGYFPNALAERFGHLLEGHRLRRELVASVVSNDVVNRMGATFVTRLAAETGAAPATVAAAYWVARTVVDSPVLWGELEGEEAQPRTDALLAAAPVLSDLLEALTRDYLRKGETGDIAATVARDRPALAELAAAVLDLGTPHRRRLRARRAEALMDSGLDPAMAVRWAALPELAIGPDASDLARLTGRPVTAVAGAVLQLGESLGIDRLADRLSQAVPHGRWATAAWRGLHDDLDDLRRAAARRALVDYPDQPEPEAVLRFLVDQAHPVAEVTRLLRDIESEPQPSLDAIAVAVRAVRRVVAWQPEGALGFPSQGMPGGL
ncbi:MAG TPA: NAD-glutamate dehydrogenase domain-containing protein [Acidimicrobiales bacterium]|nr:NAD-glutamate dehydrogenase domain-containing protein [Acidimicrobiales bacterium]